MKLTILALTFFCLCSFYSHAQTSYSVKGEVVDSAINAKLAGSTITVLNSKDSIMRAFTWAGSDGSFAINKLGKGNFILLITYPGYADYVDNFTLDSVKNSYDVGKLNMILKSRLLADVIIKGEVTAIKIKGDTTEFNARAYKIEPNAKVEDLLKQLPGIEVDKDGKITAQGETVNKVLVDGEEFFGDDPTLVTKNIRADMVDKVQLYDKKSDQATFTGIDDGVKDKTINIKLKADKKNGYFGKATAGVGTDGYYENQLLFNKFKAKEKFSVYGTLGNDGKTGLGWEDSQKAGLSNNVQFGDGGGIYIYGSGGDDDLESFDGHYNGQGIPIARSGGVHYDSKWDNDKQSINTNYKIGSIEIDGTNDNFNQNNYPGSVNLYNSHQDYFKKMFRQKLDVTYEVKLDTTQSLKFDLSATDKNSDVTERNQSTTKLNDTLINTNRNTLINHVNQKIFNGSVFYTKKFKKPGRTLSLLASTAINQSDARGYLISHTNIYNKGIFSRDSIINQYKTNVNNSAVFNTNLTYTEPLTKRLSLILNYALGVDNGTSNRQSYDSTAINRYDHLDTALSNDFRLNQFSNQLGAILNYKKDKNVINFGTKVSDVSFNQIDEFLGGNNFKRHFLNWQPQASYQYRFSQQQSLRISYFGNTTQPTIDQIQPVKNNSNPLFLTLGNPDLKPSFNNSIYFNYNSYKVLTGQDMYAYGSYQFTSNPIVTNNTFNKNTGVTTNEAFNLSGKTPHNFYFGGYFGQKIKKGDFNLGLDLSVNGNTSFNYSDNALNQTDSYSYSAQLRIQKYKVKKFEVNVSFGPNYTINQSSLNPETNNNGLGYSGYAWLSVYLPGKLLLSSNDNYQYNPKTSSFSDSFSKLIINTSLTKSFFKEENLKLILSGNDLLNQNTGFSRGAYGSTINETRYTTIKRFFMLSISWDFNKMGGGVTKK